MTRSCSLAIFLTIAGHAYAQTEGTCMATGGKAALDRLLEQELNYPAVALEAGIKGEVVVTVHLDPSGALRDMVVGRSLSPECDSEALRLVHMVLWKPSTAGEACSSKDHYLAIPFDPSRYKRWAKARHTHDGDVFLLPIELGDTVHAAKQLETQISPNIPNGMRGLSTFIAREMRYPPEAFRYSLDGTVQLEFVVEPTGSLSNMHALQDVGGGCTDEAMRLMQRIAWKPGVRKGQRVRSTIQVSIRFDLPKEQR